MAQPVWVLSVDLQTKTATFQSGMSDAAKSARGSFNDIKAGAGEMSTATSGSMSEARHGVMLLGEEFGVHLPRGVTAFLTSLGPVASAMEAAFPFLAVVVGATVLIEHLSKMHEEAEKTAAAWKKVGDVGASAFESMHDRLVDAEIKADELAGDHLDALQLKLEKIDHQTMRELVSELDKIASAADTAFKGVEHGWFMRLLMGDADVGPAKQQLDSMIAQIDKLRQSGGKPADVQALIGGDLKTIKSDMDGIWNRLETAKKNLSVIGDGKEFAGMRAEAEKAASLAQQEWGFKQKELDTLNQMKTVVGEAAKAATQEEKNTKTEDAQREQAKQDAIYRTQQEGLDRRAKAEQEFYAREHKAADAAAKQARDTASQLGEEQLRATEAVNKLALEQMAEEAKIRADLGKEAAEHGLKMGQLQIEADKIAAQARLGLHRQSEQEILDNDLKFSDEQYQAQLKANAQEIAALDKTGKDYQVKLKTLQDKEEELTRAHENQLAQIREKAEEQSNARILSARQRLDSTLAAGLTQSIMGHQTWAKMMVSLGDQVASGMIENAIKSILADDMTKERDAAAAARDMFKAGMKLPFPANIVAAPALAAGAFAAVMAFHEGGIVPGTSNTDSVPAMLTPGESVLPKDLTEGLKNAASSGSLGSNKPAPHFHAHFAPQVQAVDAAGVDKLLTKHADTFHKHFEAHVRRMNR